MLTVKLEMIKEYIVEAQSEMDAFFLAKEDIKRENLKIPYETNVEEILCRDIKDLSDGYKKIKVKITFNIKIPAEDGVIGMEQIENIKDVYFPIAYIKNIRSKRNKV